jgi:asparagine synthase (glutamine-hydrolysing)
MCGIAGIIAPDWSRERTEAALGAMCDAMRHRGPDDAGMRWQSGIGLAMRRLSIVDVAGGHQPISNEDDSAWIVFNGEIYNAPELRRELEARGHRFRTRTDTEVIVHLYAERGLDFAESMRGMWALAIHDVKAGRVVVSRDRFGIKPLYVLEQGGLTVLSSELRGFRAMSVELASDALAIDPASAHAMLSWSYVPGTRTIYRCVRSVEPGTHEVLSPGREPPTKKRYWQLRPSREAQSVRTMGEAAELVDRALRSAVKEHLESDVAVGAFVSGGIDSGLVAAYAAEALPSLSTFAIGFDVRSFDESDHAAAVAAVLKSNHFLRRIGTQDVYGALVDVISQLDAPFGDSSIIAAWTLSELAAQTHKVVLSGDGGDEIFAGYVKHSIVHWRRRLGLIPARSIRAFESLLRSLPQSREKGSTNVVRKARKALGALGVPAHDGYAALTRIATLADTAGILAQPVSDTHFAHLVEQVYSAGCGDDELSRTLATDLAIVLPNDMLFKVDQASMLNSLEARVPFLDHRLVEIGWSLPDAFKLGPRRGKLVLRELFRRRFPARLAERPKQGFQVPVESWLAGPLVPALDWAFSPERLERHGLLDPRRLAPEPRRALLSQSPLLLWNAFCLAVWCETSTGAIGSEELRGILTGGSRDGLGRSRVEGETARVAVG